MRVSSTEIEMEVYWLSLTYRFARFSRKMPIKVTDMVISAIA